VVVLALLVCGVVVALAAPAGRSRPISKAQAAAFAQAVNLRAADVVSITTDKDATVLGTERVSKVNHATGIADCAGSEPKFKGVIEVTPPLIHLKTAQPPVLGHQPPPLSARRGVTVLSRVYVLPTVGAAREDVAVARRCVAHPFPHLVRLGLTLPNLQLAAITFLSPAQRQGGNSFARDESVFAAGRAEIVLMVISVTTVEPPFSEAMEQKMLSLLHSRAEAHKL
jgi:hypothetical protein